MTENDKPSLFARPIQKPEKTLEIDRLSALLSYPWYRKDGSSNEICGCWVEDGSRFTITCPEQLVPLMIRLQNILSDRYGKLCHLRHSVMELERSLQKILGETDENT